MFVPSRVDLKVFSPIHMTSANEVGNKRDLKEERQAWKLRYMCILSLHDCMIV